MFELISFICSSGLTVIQEIYNFIIADSFVSSLCKLYFKNVTMLSSYYIAKKSTAKFLCYICKKILCKKILQYLAPIFWNLRQNQRHLRIFYYTKSHWLRYFVSRRRFTLESLKSLLFFQYSYVTCIQQHAV